MQTAIDGRKVYMRSNARRIGTVHGASAVDSKDGAGMMLQILWDAEQPGQDQEASGIWAGQLKLFGTGTPLPLGTGLDGRRVYPRNNARKIGTTACADVVSSKNGPGVMFLIVWDAEGSGQDQDLAGMWGSEIKIFA